MQVGQKSRSRTRLTVHKDHVLALQIFKPMDAFGIAPGNYEALGPVHKVYEHDLLIGKEFFDVAHIILTRLFIEQMRTREMRLSALERKEAAHASDVRRGKRIFRV